MEDEPTTQELRVEQASRATRERAAAADAESEAAEHAHERRADKAAYLRDKLAEAEQSERDG